MKLKKYSLKVQTLQVWQPGVRQRASIQCRPPAPTMKRSRKAFWPKKNVQAGQAEEKWRKQEGSVDQILAMSNCPKVQLSTFTTDNWASPAAGLQCSPSSHQLDWVTQDTMRRTGNQRSPNNLDPRSSPSYNFLPNLSSSVCFPQLYPARATLTVHFFAQSHPSHPMAPLYFKLRFLFTPDIWSTESPPFHCFSVFHRLFIKRMFSTRLYSAVLFFAECNGNGIDCGDWC